MSQTKIEWIDYVWNPVTGCSKVSPGCQHCYAERMAKQLQAMGQPNYRNGFKVTCHPDALRLPLKWKKPHLVFVNSMSDLFHEAIPNEFIYDVYDVMLLARHHTFIVLTKRPERICEVLYGPPHYYLGGNDYLPNVWHLVSVEDQETANKRIPALLRLRDLSCAWPVLGISCEPLLGPIDISEAYDEWWESNGLDWVIVGSETGPNARPMKIDWARRIRDDCNAVGVPFFFKAWIGIGRRSRLLDGREWNEMPVI